MGKKRSHSKERDKDSKKDIHYIAKKMRDLQERLDRVLQKNKGKVAKNVLFF